MSGEWQLFLVGSFRLVAPDGREIVLTSNKARAILAILALSPGRKRARSVLQDLLWSRFQPQQAAGNLRGALSYLSRVINGSPVLFGRNARDVWLGAEVCIDTDAPAVLPDGARRALLLENLKIHDSEFQDWLAAEQSAFEDRFAELPTPRSTPDPRAAGAAGPAPPAPPIQTGHAEDPCIVIARPAISAPGPGQFLAGALAQIVARGIVERTAVRAIPEHDDAPGLRIAVEASPLGARMAVQIGLSDNRSGQLHWSRTETVPEDEPDLIGATRIQRLINQATDIGMAALGRLGANRTGGRVAGASEGPSGSVPWLSERFAAISAAQGLLMLEPGAFESADRSLAEAALLDGQAVHDAWRAYLRCFQVGERMTPDPGAVRAEAETLIRRALAAEPWNATILALGAHVQCFLLKNYALGHELAEQALRFSPHHPLGLAFLGRAKSFLGQYAAGYELTQAARRVAGPGAYSVSVDIFCAINAVLNSRFDEAIRLGELVQAAVPDYKPAKRLLLPLYIRIGRRDRARGLLDELRRSEPDFSIARLKDESYPSIALRQSGLLEFSENDI